MGKTSQKFGKKVHRVNDGIAKVKSATCKQHKGKGLSDKKVGEDCYTN